MEYKLIIYVKERSLKEEEYLELNKKDNVNILNFQHRVISIFFKFGIEGDFSTI